MARTRVRRLKARVRLRGPYQSEAARFLSQAETPSYVAVVGKLRTYEAGDRVNVAIEPESITTVDEATRDAWVAETAVQTRDRLDEFGARRAPFSEQAREAYGEDVSPISEAVVAFAEPDDA